jgi:hypothetical protein
MKYIHLQPEPLEPITEPYRLADWCVLAILAITLVLIFIFPTETGL